MKNLSSATRIGTDTGYLNGNLIDGQTLLDTAVLQDMIQFFQKLKAKAAITENGLFDNETNGYQLVEALDKRNFGTKSNIFQINELRLAPINPGFPWIIYYPYGLTLNFAKFVGMVYVTLSSGATSITDLAAISTTTNLATGVTITSGTWEIKGYTDRIEVTNISAPNLSGVTLSLLVFGAKN